MSRTITEIYEHYNIPPWLQEHMLRVSAVSSIICDQLGDKVRKHEVVSACLLHDMGNIIKFDFDSSPEFYESLGGKEKTEHWKRIQGEYFEKYGRDEHAATNKIALEIGVSADILRIITQSKKSLESPGEENLEDKIATYSDMRVGPHGVISFEKRLSNIVSRSPKWDEERAAIVRTLLQRCEKVLFSDVDLDPENITDERIKSVIEELR